MDVSYSEPLQRDVYRSQRDRNNQAGTLMTPNRLLQTRFREAAKYKGEELIFQDNYLTLIIRCERNYRLSATQSCGNYANKLEVHLSASKDVHQHCVVGFPHMHLWAEIIILCRQKAWLVSHEILPNE